MGVTILVAYDDNRVIGYKQKIPWQLVEDLRLFHKRTLGYKVLMGRKTWDNLPEKPLPGRLNIVLTRKSSLVTHAVVNPGQAAKMLREGISDGPVIANDIVEICKVNGENLFIIGGYQIYELSLKLGLVDNIIVSKVLGRHEGDVYFPILPEDRWSFANLEKHNGFEILEYTKKVRQ